MKIILLFTILSICSCQNNHKKNTETGDKRTNIIDSLFNEYYKLGKFNGNVLVAENGKIIYQNSFGFANEEAKEPLHLNSIFDLASVSKEFTATAIILLKKDGKLSLEDEIGKHLPELDFYDGLTIKHLLNHTSGIPDYETVFSEHWEKSKIATNSNLIELYKELKPKPIFLPGEKFEYSNTGYVLLASIIEKVSNKDYPQFLKERIFKPSGMENSFVLHKFYKPMNIGNLVQGYFYSDSLKSKIPVSNSKSTEEVVYLDGMEGDGAIHSTIGDMLKWDRVLYSDMLIDSKDKNLMFANSKSSDGQEINYGFGWMIEENPDLGKIVLHSGDWAGFITYFARHLDNDKTIILLQNNKTPDTRIPRNGLRKVLYPESVKTK